MNNPNIFPKIKSTNLDIKKNETSSAPISPATA